MEQSEPEASMDAPMEDPLEHAHLREFDTDAVVPSVLAFFGKKHTLAIMYEFAFSDESLRFKDLETRLGISSTTLSNRLTELTERGYIRREAYDEIPPRVEYEATEKTRALAPIFVDLYEWAKEYEADPDAFEE